MSVKYTVLGKNYDDVAWGMFEYTNSIFKAFYLYVKAMSKYEYVQFEIRK